MIEHKIYYDNTSKNRKQFLEVDALLDDPNTQFSNCFIDYEFVKQATGVDFYLMKECFDDSEKERYEEIFIKYKTKTYMGVFEIIFPPPKLIENLIKKTGDENIFNRLGSGLFRYMMQQMSRQVKPEEEIITLAEISGARFVNYPRIT